MVNQPHQYTAKINRSSRTTHHNNCITVAFRLATSAKYCTVKHILTYFKRSIVTRYKSAFLHWCIVAVVRFHACVAASAVSTVKNIYTTRITWKTKTIVYIIKYRIIIIRIRRGGIGENAAAAVIKSAPCVPLPSW